MLRTQSGVSYYSLSGWRNIHNKYGQNIYISPTLSLTYDIINVSNKVGDKKLLNSRRSHILEEIRNTLNATQAQLPQIIGIGLSVIENNIGFLKEDSSIERIGSNKTGYSKVKE